MGMGPDLLMMVESVTRWPYKQLQGVGVGGGCNPSHMKHGIFSQIFFLKKPL